MKPECLGLNPGSTICCVNLDKLLTLCFHFLICKIRIKRTYTIGCCVNYINISDYNYYYSHLPNNMIWKKSHVGVNRKGLREPMSQLATGSNSPRPRAAFLRAERTIASWQHKG